MMASSKRSPGGLDHCRQANGNVRKAGSAFMGVLLEGSKEG